MSALTRKQYWQLLIPLGIVLLCEVFAIYTYNFASGLIGGIVLVVIFHVLFAPKYRIVALAIFFLTFVVFLLLAYFGCPSLPELICRSTVELAWTLESLYFTILFLAFVLTALTIKFGLSMKSGKDA
jgi:hypothetical protein